MSKILITGTNSFVGIDFKEFSRYKDIDCVSLIENSPKEIVYHGYDVVLHLTAIVHQDKSIPDTEYFRVNRDLALEVAKNAKRDGISQFVFMSTIKVYGDDGSSKEVQNENSPCKPQEAYGKSKYEAELGLQELEDEHFKVAIVRTPLIYGEGVKANMFKFIKLVEKFPFLPFGKLENKRSITYVGNLAGYLDKIIELEVSGIFIAQDEKAISTTDLVSYIAHGLSRNVKLINLPKFMLRLFYQIAPNTSARLFDSLEFNNTFTKEKLNYIPSYKTKEGIERMVNYYKNNKES